MVLSVALAGCGGGTENTATNGEGSKPTEDQSTAKQNVSSGGDEGEAQLDAEQVLHVYEGAEPPELDSAKSTDAVSFEVLNAVMAGLTRIDETGNPVPEMAEDWDVSDDGKTYTFHLRDAKWSNGEPVTANDFKFAWMRAINAENASQYAFIFTDYIKNAEGYFNWTAYQLDPDKYMEDHDEVPEEVKAEDVGIKVIDDKTLEVELVAPTPYFTSLTAFPVYLPINEDFFTQAGDKYGTEDDQLIYNGPFLLTEWQHEKGWVYKKNPDYWDADTVKLEKVIVDVIKDPNTALNLYEAGDLDLAPVPPEQVPLYQEDPNYFTWTDLAHFYLVFNQDINNYQGPNPEVIKALANAKVRKAISLALDRQGHADIVLNNGSLPAYGFVPYGIRGFREANGDLFQDDPEQAKQLLEEGLQEAGVAVEDFKTIRYLTGDSESARKTAEFLKENLRSTLGIELDIQQVTFQERLKRSREGNFDLVLSGWGPDYNDPMTFMDLFVTDGPYNDGGYSNQEFDDLIKNAKVESDPEKRMQMMMDAEKILIAEDMAVAPLYFRANANLLRPYVKELHFHGIGPSREYKWTYISGKNQ
ncbi:MAG: peptide ABC transporter substrate-binding protein [Bacillaceae bacterium]|nr:peptide ABC transporter substrate-binding protein [Bacillaceae bacterium]